MLLKANCKISAREPKNKTGDVSTITQSFEKSATGSGMAQTVVMKRSGSKGRLANGSPYGLVSTSKIEGATDHVIAKTKQAIQKLQAIEANTK